MSSFMGGSRQVGQVGIEEIHLYSPFFNRKTYVSLKIWMSSSYNYILKILKYVDNML